MAANRARQHDRLVWAWQRHPFPVPPVDIIDDVSVKAEIDTIEQRILTIAVTTCGAPHAQRLAALSDWLLAAESTREGTARTWRNAVKGDDAIAATLACGRLAELVSGRLGTAVGLHDVIRFRTVMADQPFTRSRPHQDLALWPDRPNNANVWIALDDIPLSRAPLCLIKGSERYPRPHRRNEFDQDEIALLDEAQEQVECFPLLRGQCLLFDPRLVHYSGRNETSQVRWSLDLRYVSV